MTAFAFALLLAAAGTAQQQQHDDPRTFADESLAACLDDHVLDYGVTTPEEAEAGSDLPEADECDSTRGSTRMLCESPEEGGIGRGVHCWPARK
jgi:hypothetical protein